MIWLAILILAAAAMAPLALALRRRTAARGRTEAALALHRAQLTELDRDRDEGRIAPREHATAILEVQRRMLAEAAAPDASARTSARAPVLVAAILVPLAALGLYLADGSPNLPAAPLAARLAAAQAQQAQDDQLIAQLRAKLATLDPHSPEARAGFILLGNVEQARQHWQAAADAWAHALTLGFDPTLAAETAEATTRAAGHPTPAALALFRQALAQAPADAPWRSLVEQRLAEAGGK